MAMDCVSCFRMKYFMVLKTSCEIKGQKMFISLKKWIKVWACHSTICAYHGNNVLAVAHQKDFVPSIGWKHAQNPNKCLGFYCTLKAMAKFRHESYKCWWFKRSSVNVFHLAWEKKEEKKHRKPYQKFSGFRFITLENLWLKKKSD